MTEHLCRLLPDHPADWLLLRGDDTSSVLNGAPSYYCSEHLWHYELICEQAGMEYTGERRVFIIQPLQRVVDTCKATLASWYA